MTLVGIPNMRLRKEQRRNGAPTLFHYPPSIISLMTPETANATLENHAGTALTAKILVETK